MKNSSEYNEIIKNNLCRELNTIQKKERLSHAEISHRCCISDSALSKLKSTRKAISIGELLAISEEFKIPFFNLLEGTPFAMQAQKDFESEIDCIWKMSKNITGRLTALKQKIN